MKKKSTTILLTALHTRFRDNGKWEALNVIRFKEERKAIAAHDASIRGATWICAANAIADEMASNKSLE